MTQKELRAVARQAIADYLTGKNQDHTQAATAVQVLVVQEKDGE